MAEVWKPHPIEVYKAWVLALDNPIRDLTDWEFGFVNDLRHKLARNFNLSQLQAEKLEDIYAAKTG